MLYHDALVSINGKLMKGRIEVHKGNLVYDPQLYERYYNIFDKTKFKYLSVADELIDNNLPKCKVLIYIFDNKVELIVNNELIDRVQYDHCTENA